jgi:hypothetical protein
VTGSLRLSAPTCTTKTPPTWSPQRAALAWAAGPAAIAADTATIGEARERNLVATLWEPGGDLSGDRAD